MVKWAVSIYETPETIKAAIEAIDNTVEIHIVPIFKDKRQQYMLVIGDDLSVIDGGDA